MSQTPDLAAVLALMQQQMQQQAQQAQQAEQRAQQQAQQMTQVMQSMQSELTALRQASSRPTSISTTLEVAQAALADITSVDGLVQGSGQSFVDNWTRAVDHLKCGASIKDAFTATSTVSAEDIREAKFTQSLVKALGGSRGSRGTVAGSGTKPCRRCQRPGHLAADCFAKTTAAGVKLERD